MGGFIHNRARGAEIEAAAVEPFEIVRRPLGQRSERIFPGRDGHVGTTYESHEIELRRSRLHNRDGYGYVIVMRNGSGVSVLDLPTFYDNGDMMRALLEMPDPILYATLYTIWAAADAAHADATKATAAKYASAFVDKRLKIKRRSGQRFVEIVPWFTASANPPGEPPITVPGRFATSAAAFEAAKAAHPSAGSYSATPHYE